MSNAFTTSFRQCAVCGAAVEVDDTTLSTTCAYCRSQLVDAERGRAKVDRVAPFRIPRTAAEDRLRAYVSDDFWAPRQVRAAARTARMEPDDLRGVLVPFYAYTATVRGKYHARIGIDWFRTETRTNSKGETETVKIRETEWLGLRGTAAHELHGHLVSASTGLTQAETMTLAPYDLGRAGPFNPHLLAGFEAEVPSRTQAEVDRDAKASIQTVSEHAIRRKLLPGDRNTLDRFDAEITIHDVELVLLPAWVASFRVSGRVIRLLVHGQTGRCIGKVPVSRVKVALAIVLGAALLIAAYVLLGGSELWT